MRYQHEKWRKLYVNESGTFAQLPWLARAAAAEILKIVDEEGGIDIKPGTKSIAHRLVDTVGFRMGTDRNDRRVMVRLFDLLLQDGYLVVDGDRVMVKNFTEAQSPTTHKPTSNQSSTTLKPISNLSQTSLKPVSGQSEALADNVTPQNQTTSSVSIDKNRIEENSIEIPTTPQVPTPTPAPVPTTAPKVPTPGEKAEEVLTILRKESDGLFQPFASATLIVELGRIIENCTPKLTRKDFVLLGKCHAAGRAWPRFDSTPSLSLLLKNDGEMLLSGIQHAREWKEELDARYGRNQRVA